MENIAHYFRHISVVTYLIVFFAGIGTSFTPCIYPLIPIAIGVIGSNQEKSRWRNFILSFSYALGMALTFSILGLVSALGGRFFGELQTSPWTQIIVGSVIIVFALALLDVITLPTFFLSRIGVGKVRTKGSLFSVFLMGAASGFVAAPCTVAILGALLAYVATTQNLIFGFTLLFTFGLGLGALLMLVGTFAGILANLPKLERWTPIIQKLIAWAMIILGGYFILTGCTTIAL